MIYTNDIKTLRIRPFNPRKDITENYLQWFEDPDVTRHNSHGIMKIDADDVKEHVADKSRLVWAIEVRDKTLGLHIPRGGTGKPRPFNTEYNCWAHVGNVALQSINWINRSAELAIIIGDKGVWGRGIGVWACQKVLYHAFYIMGLNRVWTGTSETNEGMQVVALKIGMHYEGTFSDGMWLNGSFVDVPVYAIIEEHIRGYHTANQELIVEEE